MTSTRSTSTASVRQRLFGLCVASVLLLAASPAAAQTPALAAFSDALEALAVQVGPSVVQINVSGYTVAQSASTGGDTLLEHQRGTGSGVILDPSGYIITNYHVVESARRVQVVLPPAGGTGGPASLVRTAGRTLEGTVVGIDEETDLAVIKVNATGLAALPLGDSDLLRAGQIVAAFGSPLGLENSMTMGVVSAVGRQLEPDDPMVYVQTDAPINPGNSGGALVNIKGQLVGINTLILSQGGGNEGLGFAAPSNIVKTVFEQIRKAGRVKRGTIGVAAQTITPTLASALKLPQDSGVILADVYPDEPGDAAGLKIGDIVLSVDGKAMENGRQLDVNLYQRAAGDVTTLVVLRDGQRLTRPVAVAERDGDPARFSELVTPERNLVERLGVLAVDLTQELATAIGDTRVQRGVLVAARALMSGAEYGLHPGDVIVSVNGAPTASLATLRSLIGRLPANAPCALQVARQNEMLYLSFEIE
jgi:serine protease Do